MQMYLCRSKKNKINFGTLIQIHFKVIVFVLFYNIPINSSIKFFMNGKPINNKRSVLIFICTYKT